MLHFWGYEKNCYFLKLELLHLWEYLKNCHIFAESAAFPGKSTNLLLLVYVNYVKLKLLIKTLWLAPPDPIHSGKYTGVTGLFEFVDI